MRFAKKFELAWNMLIHSKLRSWLTIIGIIIGIAAVVAIVSISNGAQASMAASMNSFGADQISVTPGYSQASSNKMMMRPGGGDTSSSATGEEDDPELTNKDILTIENVDNVKLVASQVSSKEEVVYSSKKADINIVGLNYEDWDTIVDSEIEEGRALSASDVYSAVIGGRTASGTFDDMQLNRQITINGKTFRIVGILDEEDGSIYIPIDSVEGVLEDKEDGVYDVLTVVTEDSDLVENTTADIEEKLMMSRGILNAEDRDFTVSNMISMQETISATLDTLALFLGAIAAISLLVGGIGIANTMFTSVLEKTKEIGIMKAIGAKNGDILTIFLINSGLIGLVGGIGGVVVGSVASFMIGGAGGITGGSGSRGMGSMFSSTLITWELLIFALVFSVIIGMIAGVIPAYRASRLRPVDALRYE